VIDEHQRAVSMFLAAGIPVIDVGIFGFSVTSDTGMEFVRLALLEINAQLKNIAKTENGWFFIDPLNILHDNTGAYLPGMSADNLHLNGNGAHVLYRHIADLCKNIFGASGGRRYRGNNILENFNFSALTSNYPTGFTPTASNGAITNSRIEIIDNKRYASLDFTPTGTPTGTLFITATIPNASFLENDVIGLCIDYIIKPLDNTPLTLENIYLRADMTKTGQGRVVYEFSETSQVGPRGEVHGRIYKKIRMPVSAVDTSQKIFRFAVLSNSPSPISVSITNPGMIKL
jgi:hypothetical protein